jgi:hypothetical protein
VRLVWLLLLFVIVGGLLTGSVLSRLDMAAGATVSFVAQALSRLVAAAVFGWIAVWSDERGGAWFDALAVLMSVVSISGLALTGALAWFWVRGRSEQ